MNALQQAIDAAREALADYERNTDRYDALAQRITNEANAAALRDLLAALDAQPAQVARMGDDLVHPEYAKGYRAGVEWAASQVAVPGSEPTAQADDEESAYVVNALAKLLAEIAIIVNGVEPPLTAWSYHDLPDKVRALKAQPAQAVPDDVARNAARYEWLRKGNAFFPREEGVTGGKYLDAAIDRAMLAEQEKK